MYLMYIHMYIYLLIYKYISLSSISAFVHLFIYRSDWLSCKVHVSSPCMMLELNSRCTSRSMHVHAHACLYMYIYISISKSMSMKYNVLSYPKWIEVCHVHHPCMHCNACIHRSTIVGLSGQVWLTWPWGNGRCVYSET